MELIINSLYHGFRVLERGFIKEVNSDTYLLEHVKSGARLLYLANDDDNKVFSIAFRTPPADDTGVAHILEHSSLCGSRKYHLKEPFVDLVKGSLNTFLNAMTYPDKTVYPVASRNAKDFHNLMDVYLDAVFYPLIYENPYTLRQEGWHYNLESLDGELSYNGVVYNEMKGVYSSPDAYLENEAMKALFPDTCYRFESGGYPDAIPELTAEKFLDFHKTYYSPENSFIYLYGDLDIDATLAYLNDEYLDHFTKTGQVHSEIPLQAPLARTQEVEAYYSVDAEEDTANKAYHELSIVTGKAVDVQTAMSLRLLETVLLETESSPLRRALMEAGVGHNISGSYTGSLQQPVFAIRAAGSNRDDRDKFVSVIYKTLQELTINGIDKKLLEASLNSMEFKLREADFHVYPKGLIYGLGVLDTWLYDGDPFAGLRYEEALRSMREGLNNRYYEALIENYLLDNTHKVIVTLLPQPGKEEAEQERAAQKMAALKAGMSKEEQERYIYECAELHRLQATPDSEEARASIPILKRSDIRQSIEHFATVEEGSREQRLVFLPAATNRIAYLSWFFDISGVSAEQVPLCFLLVDILGKLDSKRYSYQDLSTYASMYTGGINFDVKALSAAENSDNFRIYFTVTAKALTRQLPHVFDLLEAIALETDFSNLERFRELLAELKTDWDDDFFNKGQSVAISRLYSYCSPAARVNEQDQFSYYQFLKELYADFAVKGAEVLAKLAELKELFFQQSMYTLFYSCDADEQVKVREQCLAFVAKLPCVTPAAQPVILPAPVTNEGITTAGKVQYVVAGGSFAKHGHKFTGAMRVLETILRYEYLWTRIRIQGGAYGATARFDTNGLGVFASYRDPQLEKSLQAYQELPAWLEQCDFSARELDKYVIGTISNLDIPLTNSLRLGQAAINYLKGADDELRQRIRDEVLNVTSEDLRKLAPVVRDILSDGLLCVVGGKQPIEANQDKFAKIINA